MPPRKPKLDATKQALIAAARLSFPVYMGIVHETDMPGVDAGMALPTRHHQRMMDALAKQQDNTLIVMPRGAAKTKVIQAFIEWSIGRASLSGDTSWAQRIRILLLSHKAEKAEEVSLAIQNRIKGNVTYQAIFPRVKPSDKWAVNNWRLRGNEEGEHPNFQTGGIDSPPLGGRFDLIVLDDIADQKNMDTPLQQQKVISTLQETVYPMRSHVCRFIMLGTRWAYNDPIAWAKEHEWYEVEETAYREDGRSYWPERFSIEDLQKIEREIGPRAFAKQYMNRVTPDEGLVWEKMWFRLRHDIPMPLLIQNALCRYESWDLAATAGRKSDFSVGIHFALFPECPVCKQPWHYLIPHMFYGKRQYGYLKLWIRDAYQAMGGYEPNHWAVVEKKSVGEALAGEGIEGVPLHFRSAVGEGQAQGVKEKNVSDVAEVCRQGRVHLPVDTYHDAGWIPFFEEQIYSWPDAAHDDVVSAFVQGILEGEEVVRRYRRSVQTTEVVRYDVRRRERAII